MQFARPAIVEQTVGDVARFLDFKDGQPWAERMDCPGFDIEAAARRRRDPVHELRQAAILRSRGEPFGRDVSLETEIDIGARPRVDYVPSFVLVACSARMSPALQGAILF